MSAASSELFETTLTRSSVGWSSRALYAGARGARNWLGVAHDPAYPLADEDQFGLRASRLEVLHDVQVGTVVSLGPGDGLPDVEPVVALKARSPRLRYIPVDISRSLLDLATVHLGPYAEIPIALHADFETDRDRLEGVLARYARRPNLFMLLGGTIGNLDLGEQAFFRGMRRLMRPGDLLLVDVPLAGPGWTADREPRLDPAAYTEAFRAFLAGGISGEASADDPQEFVTHFARRVGLSLAENRLLGARTITVVDRPTRRLLLRFTRYDWDSILAWFAMQGLRLVGARSSLNGGADPFGMGVALLAAS